MEIGFIAVTFRISSFGRADRLPEAAEDSHTFAGQFLYFYISRARACGRIKSKSASGKINRPNCQIPSRVSLRLHG